MIRYQWQMHYCDSRNRANDRYAVYGYDGERLRHASYYSSASEAEEACDRLNANMRAAAYEIALDRLAMNA